MKSIWVLIVTFWNVCKCLPPVISQVVIDWFDNTTSRLETPNKRQLEETVQSIIDQSNARLCTFDEAVEAARAMSEILAKSRFSIDDLDLDWDRLRVDK